MFNIFDKSVRIQFQKVLVSMHDESEGRKLLLWSNRFDAGTTFIVRLTSHRGLVFVDSANVGLYGGNLACKLVEKNTSPFILGHIPPGDGQGKPDTPMLGDGLPSFENGHGTKGSMRRVVFLSFWSSLKIDHTTCGGGHVFNELPFSIDGTICGDSSTKRI
jgi:hypothetical protein